MKANKKKEKKTYPYKSASLTVMRDTGVCAVPDVQGQDLPAFCIYCLGPMAFSGIRMGRKYHKGERQSKIKSGWGKGWGHGK